VSAPPTWVRFSFSFYLRNLLAKKVVLVDMPMIGAAAEACCGLEFDDDDEETVDGAPPVHAVPRRFITLRE